MVSQQPKYYLASDSLNILRIIGCHPENFTKFGTAINIFNNALRFICISLIFKFAIESKSMFDYLDAFESFGFLLQGLTKMVPLVIYSKTMLVLIEDCKHFWDTKNEFYLIKNLIWVYGYSVYGLLVFMLLRALAEKKPYFHCWVPDFPGALYIIIAFQVLQISIDALLVVANDRAFLAMYGLILDQFDVLHETVLLWGKEEDPVKIEAYIKKILAHHSFLLKYIETLSKIFSLVLLGQYVINAFVMCMELFFFLNGRNTFEVIYSGISMFLLIVETSYYTVLCEEISIRSEVFALTFYDMPWYNYPLRIQKYFPFILQVVQKKIAFKAGGLFDMNREYLTGLFKGTLTLMALAGEYTRGEEK